jgi:L-threonylcarbamoyladenylate synthase
VAEVLDAAGDALSGAVERAVETLRDSGLVVLPTDTVYGVAADAFDRVATGRIASAKGRDRSIPLPVFVRSPKQLIGLTPTVPAAAELLMAAYWPGPLTIVLRAEPGLRWDLGDAAGTVAVRMPLDEVALAVVRAVGPLAVTAASKAGGPGPTTVAEAQAQLGDEVDLYLDGGERPGGVTSTIVDLSRGQPQILRRGALPDEQVLAVARGELDPLEATALPVAEAEQPTPSDPAAEGTVEAGGETSGEGVAEGVADAAPGSRTEPPVDAAPGSRTEPPAESRHEPPGDDGGAER